MKAERYITHGIIFAGMIVLVFSRIFGFYYYFDENNVYHRLDTYWIMLAINELAMVIIMLLTFKNWKYLRLVEKIEFLMFEFLPIGAIVIQLFVTGISITTLANTVSLLLVFLTYVMGYSNYVIQKERKLMDQMISAFATAIDEKDRYTGGHSSRVAKYSCMIAEKMGMDKKQIEKIWRQALLHDIGKIGVPDAILNKAGKLTDEEFAAIKTHPKIGGDILSKITENPDLLIGARWHHERFDGKGYPDGIKGEEIPLEARIIGVADSYDAMTSNRSYRPYLAQQIVRSEVEKNAGTQFDPEIAKVMLEIIDEDTDYVLHE
ncbi:MAG: HD-GYP domain-containing protein [Bacilli bacterium]|nr:HD-GYP domain-containing protein [Bacilli bacterium]